MAFELQVGFRYLKARRKNPFISVVTLISVLGVMIGVMSLVVVISVMNGFRSDLMEKILGINPHLTVAGRAGTLSDHASVREMFSRIDGVAATAPFVESQVMVDHGGRAAGAVIKGVKPENTTLVIPLAEVVEQGSLDALERNEGPVPSVIIGKELARLLGARPGSGLTVISPEGRLTPLGRMPNSREFHVSGIFDSGMYEYDSSVLFVGLREAQEFLGLGERISGLDVRLHDPASAGSVGHRISEELGPGFVVRDWMMNNKSLFSALRLEKITMFVILTMIILVGALNIVSTLVMVVMEKTGDLTILRVMGATRKSVMGVFVVQGVLVGFAGTVLGICAGLGLCHLLATWKFISLPADVFYLSSLPVRVEAPDVWGVAAAAFFLSFLATLYPSWRASRLNPAEAIRYG
ncbi:MAG TPA: lipoprotein-releasing ABC transporter permease subunit [Desulfobacteraceae bacterium]|nr:lipoprotein-releasing ABC transporter permease subunit [Desulfobacteraceae bacterium]